MNKYIANYEEKRRKIDDFEKMNVYCDRRGDFHNIIVRTIYTERGRRKILKSFYRRAFSYFNRFDFKSWKTYMITLTYEGFSSFRRGDISTFLNTFLYPLRRLEKRRLIKGFFYFWVMELQKRGVPHYHIIIAVSADDYFRHRELHFSKKWPERWGHNLYTLFDYYRIQRIWKKGWAGVTCRYYNRSKGLARLVSKYAVKYLVKSFEGEYIDKYTGEVVDKRVYLGKLAWVRGVLGRFRLYGMSQVRRFCRGVRKKLQEQYQKYYYDKLEALELAGLDNLLKWGYNVWGVWQKRTGKVVKRYCSWLGRDIYKNMKRYIEDSLDSTVENLLFELDYCSEDDIIELIDF